MRPVEMRAVMESIGLTREDLAAVLDIQLATVRRWLTGSSTVPPGVVDELMRLVKDTNDLEAQLEQMAPAPITVFTNDEDFWQAHPVAKPLPARWHRAIAGRVHVRTGTPLQQHQR